MDKKTEKHETVLLNETVDGLNLHNNDTVIDATAGAGGHSEKITEKIGKGTLIVIDADEAALSMTKERLKDADAKIVYVQGNFRNLKTLAKEAGVTEAAGIVFDLGWRADQLEAGRGLSFKADEPLVMTLSSSPYEGLTAKDIIANWEEDDIATILREFGEERFAGRIARAIVEARRRAPITTSLELGNIISAAVPAFYRKGKIHPATRTFQALRIAVNDELSALTDALTDALELLKAGGRVAVISFHSLEDRIVKQAFRAAEDRGVGKRVNKSVITASRAEQVKNRRSRSAKLRIFEKHGKAD